MREYLTYSIGNRFPYKNQFRIFMVKLRMAGLQKIIFDIHTSKFDGDYDNELQSVQLNHIYIINFILIFNIILSQIVLLIEIYIKKYVA